MNEKETRAQRSEQVIWPWEPNKDTCGDYWERPTGSEESSDACHDLAALVIDCGGEGWHWKVWNVSDEDGLTPWKILKGYEPTAKLARIKADAALVAAGYAPDELLTSV